MRPDVVDSEAVDICQGRVRTHARAVREAPRFEHRRTRSHLELRVRLVGAAVLAHAPSRPLDDRSLQVFADVEEPESEIALQPLVGAAAGAVDAHGANVDGHRTGRLDDVGVDVCAAGVRDVARGFDVVQVAVDVRDECERDEPRVAIDDAVHLVHIDLPVTLRHDSELDLPVLLEHPVHVLRGLIVQVVDHHVATLARDIHARDDLVLGVGGAADEGDLARFCVDKSAEQLLRLILLLAGEGRAAFPRPFRSPRDVVLDRANRVDPHRMVVGAAQPDLPFDPRKIGSDRVEVRTVRAGGSDRPGRGRAHRGDRDDAGGRFDELSAVKLHGFLLTWLNKALVLTRSLERIPRDSGRTAESFRTMDGEICSRIVP